MLKSRRCRSTRNGEPLTEYHSEIEAQEGAAYVKYHYGNDLVAYQCSHCNWWHLAPRDRQTPSRGCTYCTDSYGGSKDLYETRQAAERRAAILRHEQGVHLRIYKCPHQSGWHLARKHRQRI